MLLRSHKTLLRTVQTSLGNTLDVFLDLHPELSSDLPSNFFRHSFESYLRSSFGPTFKPYFESIFGPCLGPSFGPSFRPSFGSTLGPRPVTDRGDKGGGGIVFSIRAPPQIFGQPPPKFLVSPPKFFSSVTGLLGPSIVPFCEPSFEPSLLLTLDLGPSIKNIMFALLWMAQKILT